MRFLACQHISWQLSRRNRVPCWSAFSSAWHQKSDDNVELKEVIWDAESVEGAVPVLIRTYRDCTRNHIHYR